MASVASAHGVSASAINGARAAYEVHAQPSNYENHGGRKVTPASESLRKRSTSNLNAHMRTASPARRDASKNEIYKQNTGNINASDSDIPENMYRPEKEDLEGWIHREKLAKIESEELQVAGINLAKARSRSKEVLGGRTKIAGSEPLTNDLTNTEKLVREDQRRHVSSPVGDAEDEAAERANWDFRTPEEIEAEQSSGQFYTTPVLRKSGSKIPILTSSPTPIPSDRYERDTPLPRKRTMSGSLSPEENLVVSKTRVTSQRLNDSLESDSPAPAGKPSSPTKSQMKSASNARVSSAPQKAVPTSRKTSTAKSPPNTTAGSSNGRPSTRGNDMERPRTAVNRPEGDPPWLATMYKPDPMLPPDQQIIPTLAKKMQQDQWAQNGDVPKTYDREFTPLAVHDDARIKATEPLPTSPVDEKTDDPNAWPLKQIQSAKSTKENRPATSNSAATGGYSTMPRVTSPPMGSMTSPKVGSMSSPTAQSPTVHQGPQMSMSLPTAPETRAQTQIQTQTQPSRPMRMPLDDEDEKGQKKGCGCCIVM